jgi:hypothetical protein
MQNLHLATKISTALFLSESQNTISRPTTTGTHVCKRSLCHYIRKKKRSDNNASRVEFPTLTAQFQLIYNEQVGYQGSPSNKRQHAADVAQMEKFQEAASNKRSRQDPSDPAPSGMDDIAVGVLLTAWPQQSAPLCRLELPTTEMRKTHKTKR